MMCTLHEGADRLSLGVWVGLNQHNCIIASVREEVRFVNVGLREKIVTV